MSLVPIPFVGPAYQARSKNLAAQRCINWYPVASEVGGSKVRALYPTPGLRLFADVGSEAPVRGAFEAAGLLYVVCGAACYRFNNKGVKTTLGTLLTSSGPVTFAQNPTQILIADGAAAYIVTIATGVFAQVTDPDCPVPTHCAILGGFFIANQKGTGQFFISSQYDGTAWDALDYATAEAAPDNIVGLTVSNEQLWLLGEKTAEVWTLTGDGDFPLRRLGSAVLEYGCAAKYSITKGGNTLFWLSANEAGQGMVMSAAGYQPQRISTYAIEYAISTYERIDDALGFSYQQEGHTFYVLTFPTAGVTWVYDLSTQQWHERAFWELEQARYSRHRANCHAFAFGLHIVGDYSNGKLYVLDMDTYTDDGELIRRLRSTDHISELLQRITFNSLHVDMEAGEAEQPEFEGWSPQAMLRYSKDGGHTWSSEKWALIGKVGQYGHRAVWRRLGQGRNRTFELVIAEPIKAVVMDAVADVEQDE